MKNSGNIKIENNQGMEITPSRLPSLLEKSPLEALFSGFTLRMAKNFSIFLPHSSMMRRIFEEMDGIFEKMDSIFDEMRSNFEEMSSIFDKKRRNFDVMRGIFDAMQRIFEEMCGIFDVMRLIFDVLLPVKDGNKELMIVNN
jgi:hypothetical protein